jgi:hypothetical protein
MPCQIVSARGACGEPSSDVVVLRGGDGDADSDVRAAVLRHAQLALGSAATTAAAASVQLRRPSTPRRRAPCIHAVLVGVDVYPLLAADGRMNLQGAVADTALWEQLLARFAATSGATVRTTVLRNAEATRDGVLRAWQALCDDAAVTRDDTVFLHFSGHGSRIRKAGGLGFYEAIVTSDRCAAADRAPVLLSLRVVLTPPQPRLVLQRPRHAPQPRHPRRRGAVVAAARQRAHQQRRARVRLLPRRRAAARRLRARRVARWRRRRQCAVPQC